MMLYCNNSSQIDSDCCYDEAHEISAQVFQ